jgi:soluble lytic murein transglycosylase-like protein
MHCSAIADPPGAAVPMAESMPAIITDVSVPEMPAPAPTRGHGMLVLLPAAAPAPHGTFPAGRASSFDLLIDTAARTYGHDADLLRAIIQVESGFDARAVSSKGAIGLMQVMPATAARLGLVDPGRTLFDPEANVRTGAHYLRQLMDTFSGRPELAVAAYNAGEGAVQRYDGRVPPFPETQAYVRDVMMAYDRIRRSH